MANNECCFIGQNHAWILRVLCGTWPGPDMESAFLSARFFVCFFFVLDRICAVVC